MDFGLKTPNQSWLGTASPSELLRMLRAGGGQEHPRKQGLFWGVLTAAPHGVGVGQLGKPRLAEVAAVALHVLLADAAPGQRVADRARHGAVRVALAGWKRARNGTAGGGEGVRGVWERCCGGVTGHSRKQASGWARSCRWLRK